MTEQTHNFIACKTCSSPLFPFSSVLSDKIDVWSDQVYSYQLEDVLPDNGVQGGCYVYSATNPGQRRFDVFRVKCSTDEPWCNETTVTIDCRSKSYSGEHSWFPNYLWSFFACSVCKQHLGWGFSKKTEEEVMKDLQKMQDDDDDGDEAKDDAKGEDKKKKVHQKEEKDPEAANFHRFPDFLGCIFNHIVAKELSIEQWNAYLKSKSLISSKIGLQLLYSAWPALRDDFRSQLLNSIKTFTTEYFRKVIPSAAENDHQQQHLASSKAEEMEAAAKSGVKSFKNLMRRFDNLLRAGVSWINRLKKVREEHGEQGLAQLQHHNIPFLKEDIDLATVEYILSDQEDEEKNPEIVAASTFDQKAMLLLKSFVERWQETLQNRINEDQRRQREQQVQETLQQPDEGDAGRRSILGGLFRALFGNNNNEEQSSQQTRAIEQQLQQQLAQQRLARQRLLETLFAFRDDEMMSDSDEVDDAAIIDDEHGDEEMMELEDDLGDDEDDDDDDDEEIHEHDDEDDIDDHHHQQKERDPSNSDQDLSDD